MNIIQKYFCFDGAGTFIGFSELSPPDRFIAIEAEEHCGPTRRPSNSSGASLCKLYIKIFLTNGFRTN